MVALPASSNVDLDVLADALFTHEEPDSDVPETPPTPSPIASTGVEIASELPQREPRSQLMRRVKAGLEPQIEPCVRRFGGAVVGWTPLLMLQTLGM